ncbi:LysR family transcriptional regulator [Actinacidiphila alni]|uniref:LysR family transcriptional regulator n=1 Tax=Actinacidiphila alni TaxID=380248 RepID=UPI0033E7F911
MELQQMRYVIAVAETGSFTRAAERCLVVQSALSHRIARLERELGARLFDRTSRRVRLTPAGEAFLPAARASLEAADRAGAEVAATVGEVRGRLAVGVIPTVAAVDVPAALRRFHRRHPHVRVSLRMGASDELADQVRERALDVAFLGLPTMVRPRGVAARELAQDRLVALVAPDHPLAGEGLVTLKRLTSEVFVDFPAGTAGRVQTDQAFATAGLDRDVAFEVSSADFTVPLVASGLGVAMMPSAYAPRLAGVVAVTVADAPERVEYLVWAASAATPAATAFLSVVTGAGPARPADVAARDERRGPPSRS